MAAKPAPTMTGQVRQCELLAQKLYGQCRDSKSAYKTLTGSIRTLRNLLGELDEMLDLRLESGPQDVKVLHRIVDAIAVLQKLDIALVSFKCSPQIEADVGTVIKFKASVDDITHDLTRAYDVMTRSNETASSIDGSSVRRRNSRTSSAWSTVNRDFGSDISSEGMEVCVPSDEKEVYLANGPHSSSTSSLTEGITPTWRAMFTDVDPLSIPFEDAARIFFYENEGEDAPAEMGTDLMPEAMPDERNVGDTDAERRVTSEQEDAFHEARSEQSPSEGSAGRANADISVASTTHLSPVEIERLRQDSVLSSPLLPKPSEQEAQTGSESVVVSEVTTSPARIMETPTIAVTTPGSDRSLEEMFATQVDQTQDSRASASREVENETFNNDERGAVSQDSEVRSSESVGEPEHRTKGDAGAREPQSSDQLADVETESAEQVGDANETLAASAIPLPTEERSQASDADSRSLTKHTAPAPSNDIEPVSTAQDDQVRALPIHGVIPIGLGLENTKGDDSEVTREPSVIRIPQESTTPDGETSADTGLTQETTAIDTQPERIGVPVSKFSKFVPSMPSRMPPPPPPCLGSKPVLPPIPQLTGLGDFSLRPPSPTSTEAPEDLYSATPPTKPAAAPLASKTSETKAIEPISLTNEPLTTSRVPEAKSTEYPGIEEHTSAKGSITRSKVTAGRQKPRYYAYFASAEYYDSASPSRSTQASPKVISKDKLPVLLTVGSHGALRASTSSLHEEELKDQGVELSAENPPNKLSVPSRSLHHRRKSAPTPAPPALMASVDKKVASVDALDAITEKSPALLTTPPTPIWKSRRSVDEALHGRSGSMQAKPHNFVWESPDMVGVKEWYGTEREATPTFMIDHERIQLIVSLWNQRRWDAAAQYLLGHMNELEGRSEAAAIRRVKHLLAICSSFRGNWDNAIERFLEVLQKPVTDILKLDDGDCAAAYWLGDLYAMQNRRAEALLAYSIAQRSTLFSDSAHHLRANISAEHAAVQRGVSKADFKQRWDENKITPNPESPSILSPKYISFEAATQCLEIEQHKNNHDTPNISQLTAGRGRSSYLSASQQSRPHTPLFEQAAMKIGLDVFESSSPWPMRYDPLFYIANVQRSRLLAYECDMLAVFQTNPEARLSRPLSLKKIDCFTCTDLPWLIQTIRTCLQTYEMGWSEVVNVSGVWFCCRYSFPQHRIATTYYYSVSLFRHPFRSGFGVDVDDMSSARLVGADLDHHHQNGVHAGEPRRVKLWIREFLDEAWKIRKASSSSSAAAAGSAPPIPPKAVLA